MKQAFNNFFSSMLDMVLPPRNTEKVVRELSMADLLEIESPDGTLPYRDPKIRALVWELKYRANAKAAALGAEYLTELLIAEASESLGKPLLIPMPMHADRRKERGYNQTELLCEAAMKFIKDSFEYAPNILERVKNTAPQQGLARHTRLTNVKNSMKIKDPARVMGRVCVVIDDVMTTGATVSEARRVLQTAGSSAVQIVVLAHS